MDITIFTDKIKVRYPKSEAKNKVTQLVVIEGQISIFSEEHFVVINETTLFDLLTDFGAEALNTKDSAELSNLAEKYLETIKEAK